MSRDNTPSRREILKTSGTALTAGLAGCATGGSQNNQPNTNNTTTNPTDTDPEQPENNNTGTEFEPTIKKGEEFDWFPDPRRFANKNLLSQAYQPQNLTNLTSEQIEMARDVLSNVPWQIYRTQDMVEDTVPENVEYFDNDDTQVTGRGFVDANWSDMGTKIAIGYGEMGAADVKEMTPSEIQQTLNGKFEQTEQRNGRTIYTGNFTDQRFDEDEEYEVMIGHDGGNNLIWVADRPQKSDRAFFLNPFLNEIERPYQILDQTVAGSISDNDVLESVVDGSGHRINGAMKAAQNHFPNEDHIFSASFYPAEEMQDGSLGIGSFYMERRNEKGHRENEGAIVYETADDSYDLEITDTWNFTNESPESSERTINAAQY